MFLIFLFICITGLPTCIFVWGHWNYWQLWAAMRMFGVEHASSRRTASALNHCSISAAMRHNFCNRKLFEFLICMTKLILLYFDSFHRKIYWYLLSNCKFYYFFPLQKMWTLPHNLKFSDFCFSFAFDQVFHASFCFRVFRLFLFFSISESVIYFGKLWLFFIFNNFSIEFILSITGEDSMDLHVCALSFTCLCTLLMNPIKHQWGLL